MSRWIGIGVLALLLQVATAQSEQTLPYDNVGHIDTIDRAQGVIEISEDQFQLSSALRVHGGEDALQPSQLVGFNVVETSLHANGLIREIWILISDPTGHLR